MSETTGTSPKFCPQCGNMVDADARFCKHCAFDLTNSTQSLDATVVSPKGQLNANSKPIFLIGGVAVISLLVLGILGAYIFTRNRTQPTMATASPTPVPTPTMSDKAKQVEAKILRGETLSDGAIAGLSAYELRVLRNVHFARYGRKYDSPGLGDYFNTRSWYKPSDDYKESMVTSTDKANINLILAAERTAGNMESASTNTNTTPIVIAGSSESSSDTSKPPVEKIKSDCMDLVSRTEGSSFMPGRGPFKAGRYMDFVNLDTQGISAEGATAQVLATLTIKYNSAFAQTTTFSGALGGCVPVGDVNSREQMLGEVRRFNLKLNYRKYDTGWRLENWSGCR